jgi:8-oxo-dGTP pyrophosphatase MutT (NUDIX family)
MISERALTRIGQRLDPLLAPPSSPLVALEVEGAVAGRITPRRAARLAGFGEVFRMDGARLRFAPGLEDAASRSAALTQVAAELAREGALTAWRDELYAAAPALGAAPWFEIERAAARYLGIRTHAAHVNGLVRDGTRTLMWLARRSPTKSIDPGMLDNLVGGGVASGMTIAQTLVKECWEEAGLPEHVARAAQPVSELTIFREQPDGIQHETIHAHDLWLAPGWRPSNQDGEATEHRLVSFDEVARLLALDDDRDAVTADASLVALDCLRRLG